MKTRSSRSKLETGRCHDAPRSAPFNDSLTPTLSPSDGEREKTCRQGKTLGFAVEGMQYARAHWAYSTPVVRRKRPLLLLSEDEMFCWKLLGAASQVGRRLIRGHPTADAPQALRIVKPEIVLLDLDLHEQMAWAAADALLLDENCLPLILLTSHGKQSDFDTAIQAGCLIEKTTEPMRLLAVVEQKLTSTKADRREQKVIQRLVIRWLKPVQIAGLNRFWGINE
jgi:CheY-like chemotaxis protein